MPTQRREEKRVGERASHRRERERALGSSFYMFFLPPGLPYVNWASQECCLFYLRSSLRSSDLRPSFVLFSRAFPFLVFYPPPFWAPVSHFNYLTCGKDQRRKGMKGRFGRSGEVTNQYYYITDMGTKSGISEDPGKPVTSSYKMKG